jgi:hypothetical protein
MEKDGEEPAGISERHIYTRGLFAFSRLRLRFSFIYFVKYGAALSTHHVYECKNARKRLNYTFIYIRKYGRGKKPRYAFRMQE